MLSRSRVITAPMMFMLVFTAAAVLGQQELAAQPSADELAKKSDEFLSQFDKKDMPGCAVGVVKDGKLIYKRGFGMANLDYDVPNTPATRFNLASVSKAFTAFSIALLAQQGKLSLDDDIRKYVPEMPKYEDPITIRHLIHHTSGLRDYQALVFFSGLGTDNAYSEKTILNVLARQKNLNFKPGAEYQYCNSGYFLLGIIVQRVSGKSLRAFAEENIFKPLGMKQTLFNDNRFEVVKNRASGYRVGPDQSIRARASLDTLVGDGGALSSIEDLYLWDQNFFEPKVGNKELISMVTTPGTLNNGQKITYAFGFWRTKYKGLTVLEHSGNMGGYRAKIFSFPEQKFAVIALSNNTAIFPSTIVMKLADIYLEGQLKPDRPGEKRVADALPPAITLSEKEALRYAGIYAHPESGRSFRLSVKDGKLMSSGLHRGETPVLPVSQTRLLLVAAGGVTELNPVFSNSDSISEIRILTKSGKPDVFVPVKPPVDSPQQLRDYEGTYYSDELNADYKISLHRNSLALQIGDSVETRLIPTYADAFTIPDGGVNLSFRRDPQGKITGFVFNSSGEERQVKGITFVRRQ